VNEAELGFGGPSPELLELRTQVGVGPRRRFEVGLDAKSVKELVGGETLRQSCVACSCRMDVSEHGANLPGKGLVDVRFGQLSLPDGESCRLEVLHHEEMLSRQVRQDARHCVGTDPSRDFEPRDLRLVSFDRSAPLGRDCKHGPGALHAHRAPRQVYAPDVGRDAACERRPMGRDRICEEPDATQRNVELRGLSRRRQGPGHCASLQAPRS
jgi:hypothetical protein